MIRWEGLDPATVERAIKMFIRRLHSTAQGIDGSGGDGGRDVRWDSPDGLVIFEVKSYAGRLTNGQKRKIEASLARALAHAPVRWVLVLPLDPSPAEESWFDGRRARYSGIVLEWRGRDWLDGQFAAHQDLRRYVEGCNYELLERARELGHEQAALVNGSADLAARVNGLVHGRARELSPYWQVDVATEGDATTLRYSARVPDAATLDPVMLVPRFTFPADDPDAGDALRQLTLAFDYGAGAVVDGRYVSSVEIHASEQTCALFAADGRTETSRLEIGAAENNDGLPLPITLAVTTAAGNVVRSIGITLTRRTVGRRGVQLIGTDASGVMTVTHTVDHAGENGARPGTFHFGFDEVTGRYPCAVRPVTDFVLAMRPGTQMSAVLGHARMGYADIADAFLDGFRPVACLVVALDELQRHFGQLFPIPPGLTFGDLRELEVARQLVAGERARWLGHVVTMQIRAERLGDFLALEDLRREPGTLIVRNQTMSFACGHRSFDVGPIELWGPRIRLANRPELEAAVGTGVEPTARWECTDGEHIYVRRLSHIDADE